MTESERRLEELIEKLRKRGCRITPQRLAILRILTSSENHPSVEDIYEQLRVQFPTTSLATVYKMIAMLKEMNEVLELEFRDRSNRYDGNRPYPHTHLICLRCGAIQDPEQSELENLPRQIALHAGYQLVSHRFDIYGICPACQAAAH
ncbi:MAG: Fur family transcriptional regulator [Anaerolineae bacterium]